MRKHKYRNICFMIWQRTEIFQRINKKWIYSSSSSSMPQMETPLVLLWTLGCSSVLWNTPTHFLSSPHYLLIETDWMSLWCAVPQYMYRTLRLYLMDFPHDALKSASSFFLCSFYHFVTVVLQFVVTSRSRRKQLGKISAGITQIPGQCLIWSLSLEAFIFQ